MKEAITSLEEQVKTPRDVGRKRAKVPEQVAATR